MLAAGAVGEPPACTQPRPPRSQGNRSMQNVTISRSGQVVASGSFDPEYSPVYPNGKECDVDPVCLSATVTLSVP